MCRAPTVGRLALDGLDLLVDVLAASSCPSTMAKSSSAMAGADLLSDGTGDRDGPERMLVVSWVLCRLRESVVDRSTSDDDVLRFRNDREPSRGSSSRMRVLKTE